AARRRGSLDHESLFRRSAQRLSQPRRGVPRRWRVLPCAARRRGPAGRGCRSMKALITGGAGFIGSHLVDELRVCGYDVHVVDALTTSAGTNLAHLEGNPKLQVTIDSASSTWTS